MSNKRVLIAAVATAVMVGGERRVIPAGAELPDLSEHDQDQLVESGAARDEAASKAEFAARQKAEAAGRAEFQAARDAVQAQQASTAPAEPAGDDAGDKKSGGKANGKK